MADYFVGGDDEYDDVEEGGLGYSTYVVKTVDPGPSLLVGTLVFCLTLYAVLPCVVYRNGRKRKERDANANAGRGGGGGPTKPRGHRYRNDDGGDGDDRSDSKEEEDGQLASRSSFTGQLRSDVSRGSNGNSRGAARRANSVRGGFSCAYYCLDLLARARWKTSFPCPNEIALSPARRWIEAATTKNA